MEYLIGTGLTVVVCLFATLLFWRWVETVVDVIGGLHSLEGLFLETDFVFFSDGNGAAHISPRSGAVVLPSAISLPRDERPFMIAAVSTWWPTELTFERPVESRLRLIPDVAGDFCDTSRCPLK